MAGLRAGETFSSDSEDENDPSQLQQPNTTSVKAPSKFLPGLATIPRKDPGTAPLEFLMEPSIPTVH